MERGAAHNIAGFERDLPAVRFNQAFADREANAGPPVCELDAV
jgi:hypothetical protein